MKKKIKLFQISKNEIEKIKGGIWGKAWVGEPYYGSGRCGCEYSCAIRTLIPEISGHLFLK